MTGNGSNRRNSTKSTGPRTYGGKARSKQNFLNHGLSILDLNPQVEAEIDHLVWLLTEKHGPDVAILDAACTAEAQVHPQRIQAFRSGLLRNYTPNETSGLEADQSLPNESFSNIFVQVERLGWYEASALSRRKSAFRRFLAFVP